MRQSCRDRPGRRRIRKKGEAPHASAWCGTGACNPPCPSEGPCATLAVLESHLNAMKASDPSTQFSSPVVPLNPRAVAQRGHDEEALVKLLFRLTSRAGDALLPLFCVAITKTDTACARWLSDGGRIPCALLAGGACSGAPLSIYLALQHFGCTIDSPAPRGLTQLASRSATAGWRGGHDDGEGAGGEGIPERGSHGTWRLGG